MGMHDIDFLGDEYFLRASVVGYEVGEASVGGWDDNKGEVVSADSIDIPNSVVNGRVAVGDNNNFFDACFEYLAHFLDMYLYAA